jgi:hypothetical protein
VQRFFKPGNFARRLPGSPFWYLLSAHLLAIMLCGCCNVASAILIITLYGLNPLLKGISIK